MADAEASVGAGRVMPGDRWVGRFLAIWSGQAASVIGSALVQFALIWWLTITTGSATVLAIAAIMGIVPQVLLTPFAGVYVDRWRRRRTMIGADGLIALTTVLLVALFALEAVQVWQIYAVLFARSCFAAFHWPASQAATALLVPEKQLARVAGLNQTIYGLSSVLAPPIAAALFALVPIQYILSIDIATAVLAIIPLALIRIPEPKPSAEERHVLKEMGAAWRLLRNWNGALTVVGIFLIANLLLAPAFTLMPILVVDYFQGDALDLAWVEACFGGGAIAGGLLLGIWGGTKRRIVTVMAATALAGAGATLMGFVPSDGLYMLLVLALFVGAMFSVLNGAIIAILQACVDPGMQGRILALISSLAMSVTPLGLAFAGPLADAVGVQPWFILAGVVTAAMGAAAFLIPSVMRLESAGALSIGKTMKPADAGD